MFETVRYTYRLRPGAQAQAALHAEWGRCRWLWNEAVHQQRSGRKTTLTALSKLLTQARADNAWLREGSQVAQQQTLRGYAAALNHSFSVKGRRRPRAKKRRLALPSLEYTLRGFSIRDGRLHLPGKVTIPVVWSRDLPSPPTSVRVYQDCLGHWYASFVTRRERIPAGPADGGIGIDWGVSTTATTTDPAFDLPYAGHRRRSAAELAKAQRRMSRRRRKGAPASKGYQRAKLEAARLQKKAARQNTHTARVWASRIVDHHDIIAVEDFKPAFLRRSTMARKAADAAIGQAKRTLIEYAQRAGRKVVLVPPAERTFRCEICGYTADRDRNAARVILAEAESRLAGVDDVRHPRVPPSEVRVACGPSRDSPRFIRGEALTDEHSIRAGPPGP